MANNPTTNPTSPGKRKPLSGSEGAGGQEHGKKGGQNPGSKAAKEARGYGSEETGGKEFAGSRTRGGQEYAFKGKGAEYTGEHKESERPEAGQGSRTGGGGQRGERLRGKRDPSQRVTSKPDVTLEGTSETAILRTCADTCHETFAYCSQEGGDHVEAEHLRGLVDCAELCAVTANFVARGSRHANTLLQACAEACKSCEESCEEFGDDERMKACADVCRECYEHCNAQSSEKVA